MQDFCSEFHAIIDQKAAGHLHPESRGDRYILREEPPTLQDIAACDSRYRIVPARGTCIVRLLLIFSMEDVIGQQWPKRHSMPGFWEA